MLAKNVKTMIRHLIRSVKYLVFISVLFAIVVAVVFLTSTPAPGVQPWDLFKWKQVIIFFVAIAAVYPFFGYWKKEVAVSDSFAADSAALRSIFGNLHFEVGQEEPGRIVFHHRNVFIRFMRLFEDKITVDIKDGFMTIEGQRKDVVRIAHAIEWEQTNARKREQETNSGL